MSELINFIFSPPNIIPALLISFCGVYWVIVIIGVIDLDTIDVDIDADVDSDRTGRTEAGVAWLNKALYFFNLGRIPFMLWLSIAGLIIWLSAVSINYIFGIESFILGLLVFIITAIGTLILIKPITFALVKLFDALEKSDGLKSVIGQIAEVVYPDKEGKSGEVEINY